MAFMKMLRDNGKQPDPLDVRTVDAPLSSTLSTISMRPHSQRASLHPRSQIRIRALPEPSVPCAGPFTAVLMKR